MKTAVITLLFAQRSFDMMMPKIYDECTGDSVGSFKSFLGILGVVCCSPVRFRCEFVYVFFPNAIFAAALAQVKKPGFSFTVSWKEICAASRAFLTDFDMPFSMTWALFQSGKFWHFSIWRTIAFDLLWFRTSRLCSFSLVFSQSSSSFPYVWFFAWTWARNFVHYTVTFFVLGFRSSQMFYFSSGYYRYIRSVGAKLSCNRVGMRRVWYRYISASFLLFLFSFSVLFCGSLSDFFRFLFHSQ